MGCSTDISRKINTWFVMEIQKCMW